MIHSRICDIDVHIEKSMTDALGIVTWQYRIKKKVDKINILINVDYYQEQMVTARNLSLILGMVTVNIRLLNDCM